MSTMKKINYPDRSTWSSICERPTFDMSELEGKVKSILLEVKGRGDDALLAMGPNLRYSRSVCTCSCLGSLSVDGRMYNMERTVFRKTANGHGGEIKGVN